MERREAEALVGKSFKDVFGTTDWRGWLLVVSRKTDRIINVLPAGTIVRDEGYVRDWEFDLYWAD